MLAGPSKTVKRARRLRRAMSVAEVVLWTRLRARPGGYKFRRQHSAGPHILDFYCHEARLAIEVDGISHDMGDQPEHDEERRAWLAANGVGMLRIPAGDISRDAHAVIETIVAACAERGYPLHHAAARRGPPPRSGEETP